MCHHFLKRIKVKIQKTKEYTFNEADYKYMSLNDIEDMYMLKIQGKLNHLHCYIEYDIVNSLLIYIRSIVIRARVEDIQLGV